MHVLLLPERWKVWLDSEDRQVEVSDDAPDGLLEYLSQVDLDFQGAQSGGDGFYVSHAPEKRAIRTVRDLIEIVQGLIAREEFDLTGYDIRRGPRGSLDWEGVAPPPDLTDEQRAAHALRWAGDTGVDLAEAKPSQLALADAWAEYHETGDPAELASMGVLDGAQEEAAT